MTNSGTSTRRPGDRLLWGVVGASAVLTILTLVASRFVAPPLGAPPGVRLLPRVGSPPTTPGELFRVLGVGSLVWYACFLAAPLFVWMNRRIAARRVPPAVNVMTHIAIIVALAALTAFIQFHVTYGDAAHAPPLSAYMRISLITGTLPFLTVAAAAQALEARSRAAERELESERVRSQLAESRLEALTAQLQPHFLFNTLQGISTLIAHDPAAADRMLNSLSNLLRDVLRRGEKREVELSDELRVLESYLDIARQRFGERLTIGVDAGEAVCHALVPFFILQPLVENALHHGIGSHAGAGRVEIVARRVADSLVLTVSDDGPGTAVPDSHRGIGLANTTARLRELYGDSQTIDAAREPTGGFRVRVTIPFRESSAAAKTR